MKKNYAAPEAKVMLLVPDEHVAVGSWNNNDSGWKITDLFWKQDEKMSAPASGAGYWYDFGTSEIDP